MTKLFRFIKFVIFISHLSALIYLACKDINRYIDNEDSSSISFRTFNESPRDRYPVTTLCFIGRTNADGNLLGRMAIYKKQELKNKGFSVSKYWNFSLSGIDYRNFSIKNG